MSVTYLEKVADDLWTAEGRVRFLGQWLPVRMVVVRLRDGSLFVHSPVETTPALEAELATLGAVRHLVAPSKYHHLWLIDWRTSYPDATVYGAPGLPEKREDVAFDEVLSDDSPPSWATEMDQLVFRGLPIFNEVVFHHRPSRSLIVADLVFNIVEVDGILGPTIMRLNGMWKRFGPSRTLKFMMRRNRKAACQGIESILRWDFDRVVMSHGQVRDAGGHGALERAFSFLL
jgi:hypothetical protein